MIPIPTGSGGETVVPRDEDASLREAGGQKIHIQAAHEECVESKDPEPLCGLSYGDVRHKAHLARGESQIPPAFASHLAGMLPLTPAETDASGAALG